MRKYFLIGHHYIMYMMNSSFKLRSYLITIYVNI